MIHIPNPNKKRALLLIDLQPGFLSEKTSWIIPNIREAILKGNYDLIVETLFYAEKGSLWDRQTNWIFPLQPAVTEIQQVLPNDSIRIIKSTKSAFKGDSNLCYMLTKNDIEEVHLVGLDTNDCVLATAQESFDLGFSTYVLEECTESSEGPEFRNYALMILRDLKMTNFS